MHKRVKTQRGWTDCDRFLFPLAHALAWLPLWSCVSPDSVGFSSWFKVTVGLGRTKAAGELPLLSCHTVDYLSPPFLKSTEFLSFKDVLTLPRATLESRFWRLQKSATFEYFLSISGCFFVRILLVDQLLEVLLLIRSLKILHHMLHIWCHQIIKVTYWHHVWDSFSRGLYPPWKGLNA